MQTSTPSDNSPPKLEEVKERLVALQDLFQGRDWHLFQEELAKVRASLLDHAVAMDSSDKAEAIRQQVKGLDYLRASNFKPGALQDAGQRFDKPTEMPHYMALDSADQRRLTDREESGSAH